MTQCPATYPFLMDHLSSVEILSSPRDGFENSVAATEIPSGSNSYHRKCDTRDPQMKGAPVAHVDVALDGRTNLEGEGKRDDRLRRWVGLGGLAFVVVLLATVFATPNGPDTTASAAKVATFAHQNRGGLYLSAYLISLAVLIAGALLWYLRDVVAPDARADAWPIWGSPGDSSSW